MIINKKCAECGKEFEYDERPGFPRKYCFSCGSAKKASYAEKVEVVKPGEPVKTTQNDSKSNAMYVSYAKDIFCELARGKDKDGHTPTETMALAINLVKQARDSF